MKLKRIEKNGSCPVLGGKQVMKFANARHRSRVGFILDKRKWKMFCIKKTIMQIIGGNDHCSFF